MTPEKTEELASQWTAAQRTVAAFVRTLVPDFHQSEEVLQRVAVALVRKYDKYDSTRPFVAWAIGIAKLESAMFLRERGRERLIFDDDLVERIAASHERASEDPAPMLQFLPECVEELDGHARLAIQLRYGESLKTTEIAEKMQMSDGAVRMLLSRSRTFLRKCLELRAFQWRGNS